MIGYTTIGVTDMEKAKAFYSALFADQGAFNADSKPHADALYEKAISLGATCEGKPGQRVPDRFYGAYVRDPDGNKLCFFNFS